MVECESIPLTSTGYVRRVLIDTWGNVNNSIRERYTGGNSVLIDTWWNVNE